MTRPCGGRTHPGSTRSTAWGLRTLARQVCAWAGQVGAATSMRMCRMVMASATPTAAATFAGPKACSPPGRRASPTPRSAETTGDVGLGGGLVGDAEDLLGGVHLDQLPGFAGARDVEEGRVLGDPGGLLHVV